MYLRKVNAQSFHLCKFALITTLAIDGTLHHFSRPVGGRAIHIGTTAETGQLIASVGMAGGLEAPALYFEIRYDGNPDDPLNWCRL